MRLNEAPIERASALASTVLPTPGTSSISTWPAASTAVDALRHRRRLTWLPFGSGDGDAQVPAVDPDLPTHLAEDEALRATLAQLTPAQRACLLLRARDGL